MIIKPSEITPRFIEVVAQILNDSAELATVVDVVPGSASTGENLIDLVDTINIDRIHKVDQILSSRG